MLLKGNLNAFALQSQCFCAGIGGRYPEDCIVVYSNVLIISKITRLMGGPARIAYLTAKWRGNKNIAKKMLKNAHFFFFFPLIY